MIDRNHDLPVTRQAELVGLPRSSAWRVAYSGEAGPAFRFMPGHRSG